MKLLVTTGDFSRHLTPNFHYLLTEVAKLVDLTIWYHSGDIVEINHSLGFEPDFVFINEFGETNSPKITGLASLSIPFAVALHDLHYQINERNQAIEEVNAKYVFSIGRDKFYEWYPGYRDRLCWLPHHVNTEVFKDYGLPKEIDFLMMGAVHARVYPLRYKILETMKHNPGFLYHQHPGYRIFSPDDEALVGKKYAREINRAKIFLTCGSQWKYPLAKYYEVLACNTLLLAPVCEELGDIGFIPGVHYVPIDEFDFMEKAEYYLQQEKERREISRQGFEMVHARHSTARRAQELVNIIAGILRQERNSPVNIPGDSGCSII